MRTLLISTLALGALAATALVKPSTPPPAPTDLTVTHDQSYTMFALPNSVHDGFLIGVIANSEYKILRYSSSTRTLTTFAEVPSDISAAFFGVDDLPKISSTYDTEYFHIKMRDIVWAYGPDHVWRQPKLPKGYDLVYFGYNNPTHSLLVILQDKQKKGSHLFIEWDLYTGEKVNSLNAEISPSKYLGRVKRVESEYILMQAYFPPLAITVIDINRVQIGVVDDNPIFYQGLIPLNPGATRC